VTKLLHTLAFAFTFALGATALIRAQDKPAAPPTVTVPAIRHTPEAVTPLKVQIVMARYQGEKKISSMPYTLTLNAGGRANIRMGTKIPITMLSMTNVPKDTPVGGPVQYQDVGTNIDCFATEVEGGRYSLAITIDDSSAYPDERPDPTKGNPAFRQFRASNTMVLRNGETGQFTSATDKVSGETVRVDVTLTVVK
jgi:hypothetical protein